MIHIPQPIREGLEVLRKLDSKSKQLALKTLVNADINTDLDSLKHQMLSGLSLDEANAAKLASSLMSILSLSEFNEDNSDLPEDVADALLSGVEYKDAEYHELKSFFHQLFSGASNLKLRSKAKRLSREKPNLMLDARIISDIVPVFDFGKDPDGISHYVLSTTLRIDYLDNSTSDSAAGRSIFLGVDDDDLEKLDEIITRAKKKKKVIEQQMSTAGFKFMEE